MSSSSSAHTNSPGSTMTTPDENLHYNPSSVPDVITSLFVDIPSLVLVDIQLGRSMVPADVSALLGNWVYARWERRGKGGIGGEKGEKGETKGEDARGAGGEEGGIGEAHGGKAVCGGRSFELLTIDQVRWGRFMQYC